MLHFVNSLSVTSLTAAQELSLALSGLPQGHVADAIVLRLKGTLNYPTENAGRVAQNHEPEVMSQIFKSIDYNPANANIRIKTTGWKQEVENIVRWKTREQNAKILAADVEAADADTAGSQPLDHILRVYLTPNSRNWKAQRPRNEYLEGSIFNVELDINGVFKVAEDISSFTGLLEYYIESRQEVGVETQSPEGLKYTRTPSEFKGSALTIDDAEPTQVIMLSRSDDDAPSFDTVDLEFGNGTVKSSIYKRLDSPMLDRLNGKHDLHRLGDSREFVGEHFAAGGIPYRDAAGDAEDTTMKVTVLLDARSYGMEVGPKTFTFVGKSSDNVNFGLIETGAPVVL